MKRAIRILTTALALGGLVVAPMTEVAHAADSAEASFYLSGSVPEIFSVSARGLPGDLDLTPNVVVDSRPIGLLHFMYNKNVASLKLISDDNDGKPHQGGTAYSFGGGGTFQITAGTGCFTVDDAFEVGGATPVTLSNVIATATNIVDAATAGALTTGKIEDCELNASWTGTTASLPLAGKYSMTITVVMTSN